MQVKSLGLTQLVLGTAPEARASLDFSNLLAITLQGLDPAQGDGLVPPPACPQEDIGEWEEEEWPAAEMAAAIYQGQVPNPNAILVDSTRPGPLTLVEDINFAEPGADRAGQEETSLEEGKGRQFPGPSPEESRRQQILSPIPGKDQHRQPLSSIPEANRQRFFSPASEAVQLPPDSGSTPEQEVPARMPGQPVRDGPLAPREQPTATEVAEGYPAQPVLEQPHGGTEPRQRRVQQQDQRAMVTRIPPPPAQADNGKLHGPELTRAAKAVTVDLPARAASPRPRLEPGLAPEAAGPDLPVQAAKEDLSPAKARPTLEPSQSLEPLSDSPGQPGEPVVGSAVREIGGSAGTSPVTAEEAAKPVAKRLAQGITRQKPEPALIQPRFASETTPAKPGKPLAPSGEQPVLQETQALPLLPSLPGEGRDEAVLVKFRPSEPGISDISDGGDHLNHREGLKSKALLDSREQTVQIAPDPSISQTPRQWIIPLEGIEQIPAHIYSQLDVGWGERQIIFKLDPPELGNVLVSIRQQDQGLEVRVVVDGTVPQQQVDALAVRCAEINRPDVVVKIEVAQPLVQGPGQAQADSRARRERERRTEAGFLKRATVFYG